MILFQEAADITQEVQLSLLPLPHSMINFPASAPIPAWAQHVDPNSLVSFTRSEYGLSIICPDPWVPESILLERLTDWRVLRVDAPRDWALPGFYARLTQPLADDAISIYIVGGYNSDHILVGGRDIKRALQILTRFCKII